MVHIDWTIWFILTALCCIAGLATCTTLPSSGPPAPPDNYTVALHKALLFFNAQKSGRLPKDNGIPWRGDSGLRDGLGSMGHVKGGLVGGYYDSGENTKFHFPMAFAMTMLSWSVIEYPHKYKAINEYAHVRELIKWGTDYLLLTFNSSAPKLNFIDSQVGGGLKNSHESNDFNCWMRPEDMDYPRPVQTTRAGPELAGEMAAALAAASIAFQDNRPYSKKLIRGAQTLFAFARDPTRRRPYSLGNPWIEPHYNSTGYYDEYLWGATWLYYATGNMSYLQLATNPGIGRNARAFGWTKELAVLSWDNKVPGALMLLTRFRLFASPGYPFEDSLRQYHNITTIIMCSLLKRFRIFNWTQGGLIELNHGGPRSLQYVANAAFLANLYADYLNASDAPGFFCGPNFFSIATLRNFASSQIDYILGKNPLQLSYVVGYGANYPKRVHHRAASIPFGGINYSCKGGYRWRDTHQLDPNTIIGAMLGGPYRTGESPTDHFVDDRRDPHYTEPTLAGNAGLVAALVSLANDGGHHGVDQNLLFSNLPPLFPPTPHRKT